MGMSAGKCQGEGVDERDEIAGAATAASDLASKPQAEGVADGQVGAGDMASADARSDAPPEEAGAAGGDQVANNAAMAATDSEAATPLAPGAAVAAYTVLRVLRSSPDETLYLAAQPEDPYAAFGLDMGRAFVTLLERPAGSFGQARPLGRLGATQPPRRAPR